MPICLKHQQVYVEDMYCVYCGNPAKVVDSTTSSATYACPHGRMQGQPCPHCLGLNTTKSCLNCGSTLTPVKDPKTKKLSKYLFKCLNCNPKNIIAIG